MTSFNDVEDQVVIYLDHQKDGKIIYSETNSLLKTKLLAELVQKRNHIQDLKECVNSGDNSVRMILLSHFPIIDNHDQTYLLNILETFKEAFKFVPQSLKNDRNFVLKCLEVNGELFKEYEILANYVYTDERTGFSFIRKAFQLESVVKQLDPKTILSLPYSPLQYIISNREFFMKAVSINPTIFSCACRTLKADDELLFEAVKYNRQHLKFASLKQLENRNLIFRACETKESSKIGYWSSVLTIALPLAKYNPELALEIVEKDHESVACAIKHFKNHEKIIMKVIEIAPYLIFKVIKRQEWFPNMKEICLLALKKDPLIYKYLGRFRYDRDIFKFASDCGHISISYLYLSPEMLGDKVFAVGLVRSVSPLYFERLDENLKRDRDVILALAAHLQVLQQEFKEKYLPNLENDKEFLLEAVRRKRNGFSILSFASDELKQDRELILSDIRKCNNLNLVPIHLRSDREIVETFIKNVNLFLFDPSSFPDSLLEDSEFVWRMIDLRPNLIKKFPNHEFFKEKKIILKMISKNILCNEIISNELREDRDIKLALIKIGNYPFKE
ncbi:predicted protein [Naegleria gruberi]|uniref:Predicted protein n=1 Tax=Naegleria gruberi TaxID=5762 RepID=D2VWV6_NAEGR|nr:uncharacterized protein NAEGRDRAFT_73519 [Naegleria gruberi]EFC38693.1 predicted protein [Naegleria gruberi]|eukprot:XP_002671437.1 predicted protein [Naegleria gruberi strain NEG-M]